MREAHLTNFAKGRTDKIAYIVMHYTGNNGDTAANNVTYFQNNAYLGASAHFFVDEAGFEQSVNVEDTAWHCGASTYKHPECRNANSIGVELCSRMDSIGEFYFKDQTVSNAVELVRTLMKTYSVPVDHVLRHYDVTGKICPAPMVNNTQLWQNFLSKLEDPKKEAVTAADVEKILLQAVEDVERANKTIRNLRQIYDQYLHISP